ncbi:hypothetical protein [Phenylobacterium montanum]|uniref:SGNH hydrolase-type esterase domain-containing protein n=1 Tax=Phenylobacterium montanum TaxID=2823693 RepID=A0A975FZL1_9CAUL|nr:hypothetical protein [Caulobacter sp. S6]QUD88054.1 hypothetical protein KCG34_23985 [Caulobacter sp. S6]
MRTLIGLVITFLAFFCARLANAGGYVPPLVPTDMLAGQRLQTGDSMVALFSAASTGGNTRTGPWHYAFRRKIPLGTLNGATSYYQCRLTFSNWVQGPGANLVVSGSANTSGSPTITVSSTAGIWAGQIISMTGFPAGTKVASITDSTHVVANQNATSTNSSVVAAFTSTPNYYGNAAGEVDTIGDPLVIGNVGFLPTWNSGAQPIQVYFDGQKSVQVPAGASVDSDWFAVNLVPSTSIAAEERHDVWYDNQTSLYGNEAMRLDLGEAYDYAGEIQPISGTSIDQSLPLSPSYSKTTAIYGYGPTTLTCRSNVPVNANRSFAIVGDSKGRGAWDVFLAPGTTSLIQYGDSSGNVGWISRLLANNGFNYINTSQSSKWMANFVSNPSNTLDLIRRGSVTDAILALGVNDIANG